MESTSHDRGLTRLIAIFKLLKVLGLLAIGLGMSDALGRGSDETLARWISATGLGSHHSLARGLLYLQHLDPHRMMALCAASFFYAALFSIEGLGLWFDKPWAEYFTLIITVSFIPFEVYELNKHPSAIKLAALALNLAVALYLWVRIVHRRRARRSREERHPPTLGGNEVWNRG